MHEFILPGQWLTPVERYHVEVEKTICSMSAAFVPSQKVAEKIWKPGVFII